MEKQTSRNKQGWLKASYKHPSVQQKHVNQLSPPPGASPHSQVSQDPRYSHTPEVPFLTTARRLSQRHRYHFWVCNTPKPFQWFVLNRTLNEGLERVCEDALNAYYWSSQEHDLHCSRSDCTRKRTYHSIYQSTASTIQPTQDWEKLLKMEPPVIRAFSQKAISNSLSESSW